MCGFAGVLAPTGASIPRDTLVAMTEAVSHRGPDDAGLVLIETDSGRTALNPAVGTPHAGNLGLGFRRLSIIDLSAKAAQPMASQDNSVWLVFNGEIYNYRELRAELRAAGHRFRTDSDTEVILALYRHSGAAFLKRLNGMFALAIWDQEKHALLLARDRLGIKPLYYAKDEKGAFVFGSEIKSIMCWPGMRRGLDARALAEHFSFQFSLGEKTLFEGIRLLEPATLLQIKGHTEERRPYWTLAFQDETSVPFADLSARLRDKVSESVTRQLRSDVPLGCFLSGGVDTGIISALTSRQIPNLHTFTCGFNASDLDGDERFFDERQEARELSALLGTNHHELEISPPDLFRLLPRVAWHLEEPRAGISYQVMETNRMIRDHVTVVLSGLGGDELFAGYPWRYEHDDDIEIESFDELYFGRASRLTSQDDRKRLFSGKTLSSFQGYTPRDGFRTVMEGCASRSAVGRAMYFDAKTFLRALLLVEDKLSMAHSVETRVPLLDNEVIDLATEIPSHMKFKEGESKVILKSALRGLLPDEVLQRRKQGFTPPDRTWYRRFLQNDIRSLLLSERALDRGIFRPEGLAAILDEHMSGLKNHRFLIWSLMVFEMMNRLFLDADKPPPAASEAFPLATLR